MNIRASWWEKYKSYILYAVFLIIPIFVMDSYFSSGKITYVWNPDGWGSIMLRCNIYGIANLRL